MEAFKAGTAPGEPNAPGSAVIGQAAAAAPGSSQTDVSEGTGGLY
ncbi:MAG: hypothetical protein WDM89_16030 [Rhizomicrobium sp.]